MKQSSSKTQDYLDIICEELQQNCRQVLKESGSFDVRIRKFCRNLSSKSVYLYIEGDKSRKLETLGSPFYGSYMYPDAILALPDEKPIAIEFDHGTTGSRLRNALAKAAFSVLQGGYGRAVVFFFVDRPEANDNFEECDTGIERRIRNMYNKKFNTQYYIIYSNR